MNTAMARRLVLGDRVIWMGREDCQPGGPGTIIRITPHQVEVLWEGETARRYRRAQLHNLRHQELISAAAESRRTPHRGFESARHAELTWHPGQPIRDQDIATR